MQEVGSQLILTFLELFFGDTCLLEDGDVEGVLLALEEVGVEEVDDLAGVLPSPSTQDSGTVNCVGAHVVIQKWVEVQVGETSHLTLETAHLQLSLIVHLSDELLTVLQLLIKVFLLNTEEIGALLHKSNHINQTLCHT